MAAASWPACLSPEQRAAFMLQAREQTRDMSHDQRQAWRKDRSRSCQPCPSPTGRNSRPTCRPAGMRLPADRKARIAADALAQRNRSVRPRNETRDWRILVIRSRPTPIPVLVALVVETVQGRISMPGETLLPRLPPF